MMTPLQLLFLPLLLASSVAAITTSSSSSFSLDFFPGTGAAAQLDLSGASNVTSGAVSMASPRARVQYQSPLVFSADQSFSTYFSFALQLPASSSLAFFLTPSPAASRPPPVIAVVFSATHIRVELAGRTQALQAQALSPSPTTRRLHSWIDYNATSTTLHVRLSAARLPNPPPALLSCRLDLSPIFRRRVPMRAGFQFQAPTSGGNCSLFSWAFHAAAPYRMHSQPLNPAELLTTPPPRLHHSPDRRYTPWGAAISLLFAAACGAMLTFFVLFLWYSLAARRPVAPVEHPTDVVYQKIVLVGAKDDDAPPSGGNK